MKKNLTELVMILDRSGSMRISRSAKRREGRRNVRSDFRRYDRSSL